MISLSGVQAEDVMGVWGTVAPYIEEVLPRSHGEYNLDSVLGSLLDRNMQLWVGHEGDRIMYVAVTELSKYPSGKLIAVIVMLAGERADEWLNHMDVFEGWCREMGADSIRILGRPGWKRKLKDFTHAYTVLEKAL